MAMHDGNTGWVRVLTGTRAAASIASIAATASLEVTITVTGAKVGDVAFVSPLALFSTGATANTIAVAYARVSAADTVVAHLVNQSASAIDPPDTVDLKAIVIQTAP